MGGIASLKKRFRPIRMSQASVAAKVKAATFWEAPWLRLVAQAALFAALLATAAVIVLVWYFFITADGYIDYGEGLVLFHQTQAGAGLNVYDPVYRNGPPYSVPAYGPVYYYLVGAILPRQPSLLPGRLISILSLIGISGASW